MDGFLFQSTNPAAAFVGNPKMYPDALMSNGSLLLMDLGHSLGGIAGVPANDALITNIAASVAAEILGAGDASTLSPRVVNLASSSIFLLERTPKLGIHSVYTLSGDYGGASKSFLIRTPTLITNYKIANPAHHIYNSIWYKVTRASNKTGDGRSYAEFDTLTVPPVANYFYGVRSGTTYKAGGSAQTDVSPAKNTVGAIFEAVSHNAMVGSVPTNNVVDNIFSPTSGQPYSNYAAPSLNDGFSAVIYRAYSEDLTVSGRSYATVKALDKAMFDAAFAAGGKFYGDTFTAPALA